MIHRWHTVNRQFLGVSLLLALIAISLWALPTAHAQGQVRINGRIVNGTAGGTVPANQPLQLVAQAGDSLVARREATADAEGAFTFEDIPVETGAAYFLVTEYNGVMYQARVEPSQPEASWRLTIYETTTAPETIKITGNALFILGVDPKTRQLFALESAFVENKTDRTLVADLTQGGQPTGLLRFSLPPDILELDVQSTLRGGNVIGVDKGFAMTTPIPPGSHEVRFTYTITYTSKSLTFGRSFPFGVDAFEFLVEDSVGTPSSPQMESSSATVGERAYKRLVVKSLAPGGSVDITLSGIAQPSLLQRVIEPFQSGIVAKILIPVLAGILLLCIIAYALIRRRRLARQRSEEEEAAKPSEQNSERQALIDAVAELDEQLAQGTLSQEDHTRRRAELMDQLRADSQTTKDA